MRKNFRIFSLLLFPTALLINFVSSKFSSSVEKYYSTNINKIIIQVLSKITSIIPFSIYEITMYVLVFSIIAFIITLIFISIKHKYKLIRFLKMWLLNILSIISVAYFLFIVLWGINYNRLPLQTTLINIYNNSNYTNISIPTNTTKDLANLYKYLIDQVNDLRSLVLENKDNIMIANSDYKGIIDRAQSGYNNILNIIPSVSGNYGKPKYVISSRFMCYTGITGIYFPWTGEANVNISVPDVYIPSTTLHEMAHQRGFASEDEANFLSYLACINHPDVDFKYSGYILALNHTASALRKVDPDKYKDLTQNIDEKVINDLKYNSDFWQKYEGKIDQISNNFNDAYLKSNGVKEGTQSYGKIVDLILTYYKLYPYV